MSKEQSDQIKLFVPVVVMGDDHTTFPKHRIWFGMGNLRSVTASYSKARHLAEQHLKHISDYPSGGYWNNEASITFRGIEAATDCGRWRWFFAGINEITLPREVFDKREIWMVVSRRSDDEGATLHPDTWQHHGFINWSAATSYMHTRALESVNQLRKEYPRRTIKHKFSDGIDLITGDHPEQSHFRIDYAEFHRLNIRFVDSPLERLAYQADDENL